MQVDADGNYLKDELAYGSDPKSEPLVMDEETIRREVWEAVCELTPEEVDIIFRAGLTRENLIELIVARLLGDSA